METKRWSGRSEWSSLATTYDPIRVASIDGTDTLPHDAAVVRALQSCYTPDPTLCGDPRHTIVLTNLNPRTTEEEVEAEAARAGRVVRCRVVRCAVTGRSRRYAFVEYSRRSEAERAYRDLHATVLHGAELAADWEHARTLPGWRPRRLGGGFGGRRESGQLRFGCRCRPFARPYSHTSSVQHS